MSLRIISFILFLLFLNIVGCSLKGIIGHDGLATSDCLPERKNLETLSDQTGSIALVSDQYILLSQDKNQRYLACNLPESYKKEGLNIQFSLVIKEILPHERHIATPAVLKEVNTI